MHYYWNNLLGVFESAGRLRGQYSNLSTSKQSAVLELTQGVPRSNQEQKGRRRFSAHSVSIPFGLGEQQQRVGYGSGSALARPRITTQTAA